MNLNEISTVLIVFIAVIETFDLICLFHPHQKVLEEEGVSEKEVFFLLFLGTVFALLQ